MNNCEKIRERYYMATSTPKIPKKQLFTFRIEFMAMRKQ